MSIKQIINIWENDPTIFDNITAWKTRLAREAVYAEFPESVNLNLVHILHSLKIEKLFFHQKIAWEEIEAGKNIAILTGTSSGKSLCYNLPVLNKLLQDPESRALYLFPTKALSQDQYNKLDVLVTGINELYTPKPHFKIGIYDGDTPSNQRSQIRASCQIILSNPDMLHLGILPYHTSWVNFFSHLNYIILDELHIYRGIFGSHIANLIRRLKRLTKFYGSTPQYILTSATISNSKSFAQKLIGEEIEIITQDGAPQPERNFLLYNPPIINSELGLRRSASIESIRIADDLITSGNQLIIFGQTRPGIEKILTFLREKYPENIIDPISQIRGYRSGYLPKQRREIEEDLRNGIIRAVVATNALELGIDIGGINAVILTGYPGSIASTLQQAGRAGRSNEPSLAILIANPDPLDQYIMSHPNFVFDNNPEAALINPNNIYILLSHLRCSIFELPLKVNETFGDLSQEEVKALCEHLMDEKNVYLSKTAYYWMTTQYPAQNISLRSSSTDTVVLTKVADPDRVSPLTIGQIDYQSSMWMVHPEAIYLHESQPFYVEQLDLEKKIAYLRPVDTDYYTEPQRSTKIELLEKIEDFDENGSNYGYGFVKITSQVIGYKKIKWSTHEQLGIGKVDLPSNELNTTGFWLILKGKITEHLRSENLWNNEANDYGSEWKEITRFIRQRDTFRCQVCGVLETDRPHDVHHKVPFRLFSSMNEANEFGNLIALCSTCHRRVENNVRIRSGLAGLSYILSHIAPLHLMCDFHDIGVFFDPLLALFQENLPTIVIYDMIPDGVGFSEHLFAERNQIITHALEIVEACKCSDGCPSCVGPGGENGLGGKKETLAILRALTSCRP